MLACGPPKKLADPSYQSLMSCGTTWSALEKLAAASSVASTHMLKSMRKIDSIMSMAIDH